MILEIAKNIFNTFFLYILLNFYFTVDWGLSGADISLDDCFFFFFFHSYFLRMPILHSTGLSVVTVTGFRGISGSTGS